MTDPAASPAHPRIRHLPLEDLHRVLGATFERVGEWWIPARFADTPGEYRAARAAAAFADVSHQGRVVLRGPDRRVFLNRLVTGDVVRLPSHQGVSACVLSPDGTMEADLSLYDRGEDVLCLLRPEGTAAFLDVLRRRLPTSRCTADDVTEASAMFYVTGPLHGRLLARVFGAGADVPAGGCREVVWRDRSIWLLSYPPAQPVDHMLDVPLAVAAELWQALLDCRADTASALVGRDALEILRIEAGRPLMDVDIDRTTSPLEAGFDDAISTTKGPFVGRDAVEALRRAGGPRRRLAGVRCPDGAAPGDVVAAAGTRVGVVTSAVWSPCLAAVLALALLDDPHHRPGTRLGIRGARGESGAIVVPLPVAP